MKRHLAIVPLAVVFLFAVDASATTYSVIDLGPGVAWDINSSGQVVGDYYAPDLNTNRYGLYWDAIRGRENIDLDQHTSFRSINDMGKVVVGGSEPMGVFESLIWDSSNGDVLERIPIVGYSINNSGDVTGWIPDDGPSAYGGQLAVVWNETNGVQIITTDTTSNGLDIATGWGLDINDNGQVVGKMPNVSGRYDGFIWDETNGLQTIPSLVGNNTETNAINNLGQVVGESTVLQTGISGLSHAFIWDEINGTQDLGTLGYRPADSDTSAAYDINLFEQVVGRSNAISTTDPSGYGGHDAFIWDSTNGMIDLNNLIPEDSGWVLGTAFAVNDSGQIVGYGSLNGEDEHRAFLLNPDVLNGIVTEDQSYLTENITLGDTFSFDYRWEMGIEPTGDNLDVLFFNGTNWETFGLKLNFGDSSTDWASASFYVPTLFRGRETQIMFNLYDWLEDTDPTVYLRNIASTSSPVPEPSTMLLFGIGIAGLIGTRLRKKQ